MRTALVLLLVFASVLVPVDNAYACSCEAVADSVARAESKVIFAGSVSDSHTKDLHGDDKLITYLFKVDSVVKGEVHEQVLMQNRIDDEGSCNRRLAIGVRYLVFGDQPEDELSSDACSKIEKISEASEVSGEAPVPGGPDLPTDPPNLLIPISVSLLALSLFLIWRSRDPRNHA